MFPVRVLVDRRFLDEVERFGLRFTCGDCRHHVVVSDACAHAWPDALHRRPPEIPTDEPVAVVFCKEFELA